MIIKNSKLFILPFIFLTVAFLSFLSFSLNETNDDISFSIITNPVEILPPHTHDENDALSDHGHTVSVISNVFIVPRDMWITKMNFKINNGPKSLLHHLVLFNMSNPHPFCDNYPGQTILLGGPSSPKFINFPNKYGIFLEKGTKLLFYGMLHNQEPPKGVGGLYKNVSIEVQLTSNQKEDSVTRQINHLILKHEDIFCDNLDDAGAITIPANTENYVIKSKPTINSTPSHYIFEEDVDVISLSSHIHPSGGGKKMDIFLNEKLIETFIPYNTGENPWNWVADVYKEHILVKKGDVMTFESTYSNVNNFPLRDAMSIVSFYFSPIEKD